MKKEISSPPKLSIVVIFHNMSREAERTLCTLGKDYQLGADDYEVIVIDNGSSQPLKLTRVLEFGANFKYHFIETESVSPTAAVNYGVGIADGEFVAVIVDGARMVTPGLVRESLRALQAFRNPFVCALGWHLGPDVQNVTILEGYDQEEEDKLLHSIDWKKNGYRLFEISTLAQSSEVGFLGGMPTECSWFAMLRSDFFRIGGYDERFQSPGGGQVNHEFLGRVLSQPDICPVVILGEGSFHQIHGGVATNVPLSEHPAASFKAEYFKIHGKVLRRNRSVTPYYIGKITGSARKFINSDVLAQGLKKKSH